MLEWLADALTIFGLLVAAVLALLILVSIVRKGARPVKGDVLASSNVVETQSEEAAAEPEVPGPPQNESEPQRLSRTEKELAEREARVKSDRIRELQERERLIKKREQEDTIAAAPPEPEEPKDEILKERQRILDLIKKTEERYANGEMEERSFKRILSDYQQQVIDIDIQLRKKKGR